MVDVHFLFAIFKILFFLLMDFTPRGVESLLCASKKTKVDIPYASCGLNSHCRSTIFNGQVGSVDGYECICNAGYSRWYTKFDDHCFPCPLECNGVGVCRYKDSDKKFWCECLYGHTGENCEVAPTTQGILNLHLIMLAVWLCFAPVFYS